MTVMMATPTTKNPTPATISIQPPVTVTNAKKNNLILFLENK
jgi:hypothetical protein